MTTAKRIRFNYGGHTLLRKTPFKVSVELKMTDRTTIE